MVLFNLIDYNHSGTVKLFSCEPSGTGKKKRLVYWRFILGFISRNEFADVIKIILNDENGTGEINDAYIEELVSAMDFDKNGKIDVNEFLGNTNK